MNEPKRHHSVPEMLPKRFCDKRGMLWFFDKSRPDRGVIDTSASSLFVRNRQYTIRNSEGPNDWSLENRYSALEGEMSVLIDAVVPNVLAGKLPALTPADRRVLNSYVYEQWRRVPELYDRLISEEQFARMHQEAVNEFESLYRPVEPDVLKRFAAPEYLRAERHRARVLSLSSPSTTVLDVIANKALSYAVVSPKQSFLIGSVPVMKLHPPDQPDLAQPAAELWLALHSNVAVVLGGLHAKDAVYPLSGTAVRLLNLTIARQSEVFAGRDKALVQSIARHLSGKRAAPF